MKLLFLLILFFFMDSIKGSCISPIDYIQPFVCNRDINILGEKKTYEYAKLFFGSIYNTINANQRNCILNSKDDISKDIKKCVEQLTINNYTIPSKVAKGLVLNNDNKWISACAKNMPCSDFNQFVYNGTFNKLIKKCNVEKQFKILFNNTHFIQSSWYGIKYCQNLYPQKCFYLEKEKCSNIDYPYACPVSKWMYANNFMLFYILDPLIASRLPSCRIIY